MHGWECIHSQERAGREKGLREEQLEQKQFKIRIGWERAPAEGELISEQIILCWLEVFLST